MGNIGSVEIICGSMFSGKTEELMRRLRRAQFARLKIQVFKPQIDNRYSADHVQSHDSNRLASACVENSSQLLRQVLDTTRVVGIDEVQFFDDGLVEVTQKLADRGVRVILAGLDMDYQAKPFGPMPHLLAVAEEVTKLSAVCVVCGAAATRTQRTTGESDATVLVGAQEAYEARCRSCHDYSQQILPLKTNSSSPSSQGAQQDLIS